MAAPPHRSLYRRYRPQRFDEVLGQDHVTRALRNAVRDGRVGHAYLFSGPRGTGKTSTARILAKVLNCAAPKDGEPDGECANCLAVERGQLTDWLLEQDAASKSKVDDMRDLLDRVPLGTSGNRKVIILDEVHMLSQGAENALLKTLEEPPAHVVFVLATTDPQKVRPTIRSRTQHFEFRLLPQDVVADHVRHVIADAALPLDEDAVNYVVRVGGGSARDTLSALDQVAALGEVVADTQPVDAILDALVARDAGAVLVAVADGLATGRDPRSLGEALIARLRDSFLAIVGAADDHLAAADQARARELGEQLGAAGLTQALEVLGEALTELSRKPDPRVVVEVALIRLVRPDADRNIDAVLARLERLERAVQDGGGSPSPPAGAPASEAAAKPPDEPPAGPAASPPPATPPGDQGGGPVSAARAVLAANRPASRGKGKKGAGSDSADAAPDASPPTADPAPKDPPPKGSSPDAAAPAAAARPADVPKPEPAASPPPAAERPPTDASATALDLGRLERAWSDQVLPELPISVRSKWRGGRWAGAVDGGAIRFAVDNEWHQRACEEGRTEVERVLAAQLGGPVRIEVTVEAGPTARSTGGPGASSAAGTPDDASAVADIADVAELPDANDVATGGVDLLLREFGGELVEEDPK